MSRGMEEEVEEEEEEEAAAPPPCKRLRLPPLPMLPPLVG